MADTPPSLPPKQEARIAFDPTQPPLPAAPPARGRSRGGEPPTAATDIIAANNTTNTTRIMLYFELVDIGVSFLSTNDNASVDSAGVAVGAQDSRLANM